MAQLTPRISGRLNGQEAAAGPLLIAIHGGTYSSAYFDLTGHSLLQRAANNGMSAIAIDRPGYGASPMLSPDRMDILGQGTFLAEALGEVWQAYGGDRSGVFLLGHSIGAAIAATVASLTLSWPLLGLAVSGVGLTTNPGDLEMWQSLPDLPLVDIPAAVKDHVMFGPPGSFVSDMPAASHAADAPVPKAELLSITGEWHGVAHDVLSRIAVPVHYRQAEFDKLWIVDREQVEGFAAALSSSPLVDARMVQGVGHCIDFHRIGPAFQLQQLGFAMECAAR